MLDLLRPAEFRPTVHAVDLDGLRARGIRGLIIDLDNTLVPWGGRAPTPEVRGWVERALGRGFRLCVVSNGRPARVREFAAGLGIAAVGGAGKPLPRAFRAAMRLLGTAPPETAVIGDQVFTDVLGGNRLGCYTILVRPLSAREFPTTRLLRAVERLVLARLAREAGRAPHT